MSVSNNAMRLFFPKPVKKALDLVERLEPSITKIFLSGNLIFSARVRMARRSSASVNGLNLLNSGIIQVGAMNCTTRVNNIAASQQYNQAHSPAY